MSEIASGEGEVLMNPLLRCAVATLATILLVTYEEVSHAVPGVEGTFEYSFDAPWRMEPSAGPDGRLEYGPTPIQLTVHDGSLSAGDNEPAGVPATLGEFQSVTITEPGFTTTFQLSDLAEIEVTLGHWPWPKDSVPAHDISRRWAGDNPERLRNIARTSEWHALLWYEPRQRPIPGESLPLTVEMLVRQAYPGGLVVLKNHLRVYFGDAPLPRFDSRWIYGDLHYHSQGTDNDGESAYNYRGVVRALGALGVDFVLATEHASDSEQIIDADVNLEINLDAFPPGGGAVIHERRSIGGVLRDMSAQRFTFNHDLIWRRDGVNREAATNAAPNRLPQGILSHGVVPQVFLGGEIDVIPENDRRVLFVPYGNGLQYDVDRLSGGWTSELKDVGLPDRGDLWENVGNGFLFRDVQGINEYGYGREHMVYMPATSAPTVKVSNDEFTFETSVFVGSFTGLYGGASRRLTDVHPTPIGERPILPELEEKGYAFLAHHMNASLGSAGPDGPPWTTLMLEKAFASPAVLGLEFWNENERFELEINQRGVQRRGGIESGYERCEFLDWWVIAAEVCEAFPNNRVRDGFKSSPSAFELVPYSRSNGTWGELTTRVERMLHHGSYSWDMMNHWGLDLNRTSKLRWLTRGSPRRVFMAGGSDAHGDFNYRRTGYFLRTSGTNDTAIGKPRNLLLMREATPDQVVSPTSATTAVAPVGSPAYRARTYSHEQIVDSLRSGRFSITDGPALRMVIDRNDNGLIDDDDTQMGDVVRINELLPMRVNILIEWLSTAEFGPVDAVDVYVGTRTSREDVAVDDTRSRTYAPLWHGVRDTTVDPASVPQGSYQSNGLTYTEMADDYWLDPSGLLRIKPDVQDLKAYGNVQLIRLDLSLFEAAQGIPGDRFFIRAFARTGPGNGLPRYALTNPIWVVRDTGVFK